MGIQDLQQFLEDDAIPESRLWRPIDLVQISKSISRRLVNQARNNGGNPITKFSLVLDGECCLWRLYGGYYYGEC